MIIYIHFKTKISKIRHVPKVRRFIPNTPKLYLYISSRSTFLIGCLGYAVAQLWFAYSTTELMVILARMFAGLFTGGIYVSFLTYIVNVANPEDQAKYLTYNATIQSVGSAFGYMIGAMFADLNVAEEMQVFITSMKMGDAKSEAEPPAA